MSAFIRVDEKHSQIGGDSRTNNRALAQSGLPIGYYFDRLKPYENQKTNRHPAAIRADCAPADKNTDRLIRMPRRFPPPWTYEDNGAA
jgi:hypothetical protein